MCYEVHLHGQEHRELMHGVRILYMEWGWGWSAYISLTVSVLDIIPWCFASWYIHQYSPPLQGIVACYQKLHMYHWLTSLPFKNFAVRQPCHRPRIYGQVGIWVFCGCPVFEKKELDFWTTGLGSWGGLRSSRPKLYLHIIIVSWLKPIWAFEARKLFKYNFNWMTWP